MTCIGLSSSFLYHAHDWSDLRLLANLERCESSAPVVSTSDSVARNWTWEVTKKAIVDDGLWNDLDDPCFAKDDGKKVRSVTFNEHPFYELGWFREKP